MTNKVGVDLGTRYSKSRFLKGVTSEEIVHTCHYFDGYDFTLFDFYCHHWFRPMSCVTVKWNMNMIEKVYHILSGDLERDRLLARYIYFLERMLPLDPIHVHKIYTKSGWNPSIVGHEVRKALSRTSIHSFMVKCFLCCWFFMLCRLESIQVASHAMLSPLCTWYMMTVSSNFLIQRCLARSVQHKGVTSPHLKIYLVKPFVRIQKPHSCTTMKHLSHLL